MSAWGNAWGATVSGTVVVDSVSLASTDGDPTLTVEPSFITVVFPAPQEMFSVGDSQISIALPPNLNAIEVKS